MQSPSIHISVRRQTLTLRRPGRKGRKYPVSTSRFGLGTEPGSFKTPLGRFEIAEKIGAGAPLGAVFKSRVPTGGTGDASNPEDLIQTRILWLRGLDPENANTHERYIYIHGTNHEGEIGTAASHGCVRMRNADVAELYELVAEGTPVLIQP
jgi:lipoprotein-anchoring transpeptidase ErfK/SrfK